MSYRQKDGQSLQQLMIELDSSVCEGYADVPFEVTDKYFKLPAYLRAIVDEDLRLQVVLQCPETADEALLKAMYIETALEILANDDPQQLPRDGGCLAKLVMQLTGAIHRSSLSCRNRCV